MVVVLGHVTNASSSSGDAAAIGFFVMQWVFIVGGATIHMFIDRHKHGHREGRVTELYLLWVLVFGGAWAIYGGILHTSGSSGQLAESIGYTQSMFQWEVGWGDIALGVLGVGCAWKKLRGQWMTAAVVVLAIQYGGDGIGHIMEWVANDNLAPDNTWAIPSDFAQPLVAIILLLAYRKSDRGRLHPEVAAAPAAA